jgi:Ca-activated chloride channel homolog
MKGLMVYAILLLFAVDVDGQADRKLVRKGNSDYRQGAYQDAEREYRKALENDPDSYKANYNLANTLYKQKQYDAAAKKYTELLQNETDKDKLSRYYYNLGNTLFQSKKYKESVEAYKNALRNKPGDMDAKHNLQLAMHYLTKQNNQQNQGNKNGNQSDKKQDKNKSQDDMQKPGSDQNQSPRLQNNASPAQGSKEQISPQDADRILQAIENEEKEVMKKAQNRKEHIKKSSVDKNW